MKRFMLLFIAIVLVSYSWARNANFDQANKAYSEGKYEQAISLYETILKGGRHSASLYYNLGNAYFKKGNLARAILNYERAYRLSPSDKDIIANLNFAQAQIADKIKQPKRYFLGKWIHATIAQLNSNIWAYIACLFWGIITLAVFLFLRSTSEKRRKLFFALGVFSFSVACTSFYAAYSQYYTNHQEAYAIVFSENITVNSTPSNNGTELFILHEGTKVKLLDKVGTWHKIQLTDSREGWLPAKAVEKI